MKVNELIEHLKKYNPDDDVFASNYDDTQMYDYSVDTVSDHIGFAGKKDGVLLSL